MSTKSILVQGGDGTAIPAGMVGYEIVQATFNIASGATSFSNTLSTPLPAGTYLVQFNADFTATTGTGGNFAMHSSAQIPGEIWIDATAGKRIQGVSEVRIISSTSTITTFSGTCVNTTNATAVVTLVAIRIA